MELRLRPAKLEDAKLLYSWRLDPVTVSNSTNKAPFSFSSHMDWLRRQLDGTNCVSLLVAETLDGEPVGTGRVDKIKGRNKLSWSIAPSCRGKGYGQALVEGLVAQFRPCFAEVLFSNTPSTRIVEKLGFRAESREGDLVTWSII